MSESNTPKTDAEVERIENDEKRYEDRHDCYCALIKFTGQLETELAALTIRAESAEANQEILMGDLNRTMAELTEARTDAARFETAALAVREELAEARRSLLIEGVALELDGDRARHEQHHGERLPNGERVK